MTTPVIKYRCIEVLINRTTGAFNFPDQPDLRNALIKGIEIYTATDLVTSPVSGSTVMNIADTKQSTITLYEGDNQIALDMPLIALHRVQNATPDPFVKDLALFLDRIISWTKCTVNSNPGYTYTTALNNVVVFGIYYTLIEDLKQLAKTEAIVNAALNS